VLLTTPRLADSAARGTVAPHSAAGEVARDPYGCCGGP
jgi:hypothetical protein